jgi:hypothetical protein
VALISIDAPNKPSLNRSGDSALRIKLDPAKVFDSRRPLNSTVLLNVTIQIIWPEVELLVCSSRKKNQGKFI